MDTEPTPSPEREAVERLLAETEVALRPIAEVELPNERDVAMRRLRDAAREQDGAVRSAAIERLGSLAENQSDGGIGALARHYLAGLARETKWNPGLAELAQRTVDDLETEER